MEAVVVTKGQEKKMEVAEMKMLRWSLGLTKMDKVRNEETRKRLGDGELNGKLQDSRLRWLGHVVRRDERYVGKRVRSLHVGRRKIGRSKRRWEDCVREDKMQRGLSENDAADRKLWRRKIRTGGPINWD
ncbi:uncharacterized protein LOC134769392 [Penaeus indicus]|uniref:uncharacterized protein LOC134769392 n=1 Tax=Penaeus indicus TaxID=29960 RepID=UPI00300C292B